MQLSLGVRTYNTDKGEVMNKALRASLLTFLIALAVQAVVRGRADMQLLLPALLGVCVGLAVLALSGRASRRDHADAPEA